jgi:hypothetical protein
VEEEIELIKERIKGLVKKEKTLSKSLEER